MTQDSKDPLRTVTTSFCHETTSSNNKTNAFLLLEFSYYRMDAHCGLVFIMRVSTFGWRWWWRCWRSGCQSSFQFCQGACKFVLRMDGWTDGSGRFETDDMFFCFSLFTAGRTTSSHFILSHCCVCIYSLFFFSYLTFPFFLLLWLLLLVLWCSKAPQGTVQDQRIRSSRGSLWDSSLWRFDPTKRYLCQYGHVFRRDESPLETTLYSHGRSWRMYLCAKGTKCTACGSSCGHYCR
jgi:hypothetical protein